MTEKMENDLNPAETTSQGKKPHELLWIDYLGRFTGLATTLCLILSILYNYGFCFALGISIAELPMSIQDHLKSSFAWLPTAAFLSFWEICVLIFKQRNVVTESNDNNEIDPKIIKAILNKTSYPYPLKALTIAAIIVIVIITIFAEKINISIKAILFVLALVAIWLHATWFITAHPITHMRSPWVRRYLIWIAGVPCAVLYVLTLGYIDGYNGVNKKPYQYEILLKDSTRKLNANVMRSYEKNIFISYSINKIALVPADNIQIISKKYYDFPVKTVFREGVNYFRAIFSKEK